jgi:hypothetical protein
MSAGISETIYEDLLRQRDDLTAELADCREQFDIQCKLDGQAFEVVLQKEARIRALEAALRARGHSDTCVTRVRGNFSCDCGLDAALTDSASISSKSASS